MFERLSIIVMMICILGLDGDAAALGDVKPKNWPWKGMTYSVETLETNPDSLSYMKRAGGNFVRLHIHLSKDVRDTRQKPEALLQRYYPVIDRALDYCKQNGLTATISLSFFPKDGNANCDDRTSSAFWSDSGCKENMYALIVQIMQRYKHRGDELAGFDFVSEPAVMDGFKKILPDNWHEALGTIADLRDRIAPDKYLIASVTSVAFPEGYDRAPALKNRKKIIYNLHMYQPMKYTHQGINTNPVDVGYPGYVRLTRWDKDKLRETLQPVREFQIRQNALVLVGEFSAILWAENRTAYLQDLVDIFDQFGWGWAYFGYVNYKGWHPDYQAVAKNRFDYEGENSQTWEFLRRNFRK